MNTPTKSLLLVSAALLLPLALSLGCSHEISHTESDKPGWFGGHTQQETTVYRNADGSTSTSHEKTTSNP